jgi:hypothetical protein
MYRFIISSVIVLIIFAAFVNAAPIASSSFNANNEGWRLVSTLGYNGPATWTATGGNPGGCIYGEDPDEGAFGFAAPSKFLGNVSASYGKTFTFDIASYQPPEGATSWIGISGAGYQLICNYNVPASIYPAWYSRSVTMHENAGWINFSTSLPPTHQQMLAVLANMDELVIAAEFVTGLPNDISGLDNVVLNPEPATILLLSLGIVALRKKS